MRKKATVLLAAIMTAGCGGQAEETTTSPSGEYQAEPVVSAKQLKLSSADLVRVCRAAHSFNVGRAADAMKAKADGEMVRLSYVRDDGKPFAYDCIVDGNTVRTRMIDEAGPGTGPGAWSGRGSTTTFELQEEAVHVVTTFFDGSKDEKTIII